ncbi:MAG TPA: nucleoside diphosphate kinase regulator [Sideroxyarcus sp.]|nr:nucleoside diphosphate kinase regulator [Sideroxyarcus sp.]
MKYQDAYTDCGRRSFLPGQEDIFISLDDFVRLRKLVTDHPLVEELERAIVVPPDRISANIVTMHSRLIYSDESICAIREVELVYPDEAVPMAGKVSVLAPVGCALLGLSVGQSIDWTFPTGEVHRLRVERVLFQPQSIGAMLETAGTP